MKRNTPTVNPPDDKAVLNDFWMEKYELLRELNISESTFYRWRKLGLVCSQIGKLCYIRKSELHRFLLAHEKGVKR